MTFSKKNEIEKRTRRKEKKMKRGKKTAITVSKQRKFEEKYRGIVLQGYIAQKRINRAGGKSCLVLTS